MEKETNKPQYWKSLEQLNDPETFSQHASQEFSSNPLSSGEGNEGWARREFLKLMGASMVMGTTACIRRPVQNIVPYSKAPVEITPGVPNYYATTYIENGEGFGTVVKTREGRPLHMEGNALHPVNKGGLGLRAHAAVLNLYDPDRLPSSKKRISGDDFHKRAWNDISWDKIDEEMVPLLKEGGVYLLTGSLGSPTTNELISDFYKGFNGKHVTWDPVSFDEIVEGQKASFGKAVMPRYRFDKAQMVVSVGGDFLGTLISPVEFTKQFAKARKPGKEMLKLVAFEGNMTLTGANADARLRVKPSQYVTVVMGLLHELIVKQGRSSFAGDASVKSVLQPYVNAASELGMEADLLSEIAKDLWERKGKSIVISGGPETRTARALDLQVAVNFLNHVLGNFGQTIDQGASVVKSYAGSNAALAELIKEMSAGKVKTLVIHRVNPMYHLPKDSGFEEALKKVKTVFYYGDRMDETAQLAHYVGADHHVLESWSDSEIQDGVYAVQQPLIQPLYQTRSLQSSLMNWAFTAGVGPKRMTEPDGFYQYLRNNWRDSIAKGQFLDFEDFWVKLLHDGVLDLAGKKGLREKSVALSSFNKAALSNIKKPAAGKDLELILYSSVVMGDGKYANVSWLMEMPDPISKVCWDNYLAVSPKLAKERGLKEGDVVKLKVGETEVKAPIYIQPGLHDQTVACAIGWGRTQVGKIGNGKGFNAAPLAEYKDGLFVMAGLSTELVKTSEKYPLANTQDHNYMEGRQIIIETTLKDYIKNPESGIHRHHVTTIWKEHEYKGHKWAMSIDLNACTGCQSCMVACQSENNIAVVGKEYVLLGREMHWIRIDRYYSGQEDSPMVSMMPVTCLQCDNAPCETVCPVAATVHSDEGLNEMAYNRCVGTRYCANNCPYKVRRFNWFDYTEQFTAPINKQLNPDVGVRSRGVMEKCSFCVQRIKFAKNEAQDKKVSLKDGDIVTACESACPADAIVFGDMNDPGSRVSKLFAEKRTYQLLEELNTKPALRYMTKIRNGEKTATAGEHGHGGHHD